MADYIIIKKLCLVPLPAIATDPWIINNGQEAVGLNWYEPDKTFGGEKLIFSTGIKLPYKSSWEYIGVSDGLTEADAQKIVAKRQWLGAFGWVYKNYKDEVVAVHERIGRMKTALESFASFLKANNVPEGRYAILLNNAK